jgi:type I restriction enzyme R subunit
MRPVGQPERATQNRVVNFFQHQLGYTYLGNWEKRKDTSNIEKDLLVAFLRPYYPNAVIEKAIHIVQKVATDQSKSLADVNKAVYMLLRYGVKVQPDIGEHHITVWLIDWKNPDANHFGIAEEVTVKGNHEKRPDIVLYVNGIALGVLELKRSTVFVSEAMRQNFGNQDELFIRDFFATMQLVMAGNDTEGVRYGTTNTSESHYLTWKEDDGGYYPNLLDKHLAQLCQKHRFLEMIHDFTIFDSGTKKLCRPNQYFGVKEAQAFVNRHEGGIIWHTQGSGKSLTMVWLAKWIQENNHEARVLVITDRIELDEQIESVFRGVNEDIYRTRSGGDLITVLNADTKRLICSLIHKFGGKDVDDDDVRGMQEYLREIRAHIPPNFSAKGDLFVFVDECHRTQSGVLHQAMKEFLPNATFIGFTGTPLLKSDKGRSVEVFGRYIHTYKYDEAVADKVVLDLRYEARDIDQWLSSQKRIDDWFDAKTKGLNDSARAQIKQRWGTMQKVLSSKSRLEKIVADIIYDMATKDRLASGRGNALLVCASIYQACKFYELFVEAGFTQCAIVTSYKPSPNDIKGEMTGEGYTERLRQYEIYNKMLKGASPEDFEKEAKRLFKEEPARMKLLIVVDKLLTGFDAPPATYLYIDKNMRDHGLFQAICRVNRVQDDDK